MEKSNITHITAVIVLIAAGQVLAEWQRSPAPDVDKEFISGNPGLQPGLPAVDNSCWLAAASNMLAGAGYGNGTTLQARAEDIYLDMLNWQASVDSTNTHGAANGGWISTAVSWWLGSANNLWDGTHTGYPANPYTVVTPYGSFSLVPWANSNGARFIGNQLRDYQSVGLSISHPRTTTTDTAGGGHAITAWGDSGTAAALTANPALVIVADSDRDNGGDFQTYTYDSYTNPNPAGFNEGNGWYFNYAANHWFIKHIVTLCPTDSPVDPHDGPTQKVVGSIPKHQDKLQSATDLHYEVWTDYDILGYRTEIDWATNNAPSITESNAHQNDHNLIKTTRDTIEVDWDLSDNPVPYGTDVTITTEFILHAWNGIHYDDVYFTYGAGIAGLALPSLAWTIDTPQVRDANVIDITGGFVIGAFDVYDISEEPNLICEYRLIHQYSYTQDPERHAFSLWGEGGRECADFDDLTPGSEYVVGDVFVTRGYSVACREFFVEQGKRTTSGIARVNKALAGEDLELQLTDISAEFDFGGSVPSVRFAFGEYGGNINLQVNGDFRIFENFADVNGLTIGGCSVTVTGGSGNDTGTVLIEGKIGQFLVGGRELFIDDVCPFEDRNEYMATNFRFGHSYGMLDAESLWQFHDWMTSSPYRAILSQREPLGLTIDWRDRLPYPKNDITPVRASAPDCTVYLAADLNKDCCVDIEDLTILVDQWLQCTTIEKGVE